MRPTLLMAHDPDVPLRTVCRLVGLALLSFAAETRDDDAMPKVNPPATNVKKFEGLLRKDFQERFDAWKSETETAGNVTIEITHEEVVAEDTELLIFYRLVPKPTIARSRR